MHVDMLWIGPMWPKCAFGNQKGLIQKKDMSLGNPLHHGTKNCGLSKISLFISYFLWANEGCLGQKTVLWGVFDQV